jgi:nucleoside 2-deoxyribosyltransferase
VKVYLAAPYVSRELMARYAVELQRIGFTVVCSWIQETHDIHEGTSGAANDLTDEQVATHAFTDLRDIEKADILVAFTQAAAGCQGCEGHSGGRHVETGYALALAKPVVVVGDPENVFHKLKYVIRVEDWHDAVLELARMRLDAERDRPRVMSG